MRLVIVILLGLWATPGASLAARAVTGRQQGRRAVLAALPALALLPVASCFAEDDAVVAEPEVVQAAAPPPVEEAAAPTPAVEAAALPAVEKAAPIVAPTPAESAEIAYPDLVQLLKDCRSSGVCSVERVDFLSANGDSAVAYIRGKAMVCSLADLPAPCRVTP